MRQRYHYLIYLQYLGFRYSGWQKQPQQKTIEGMIYKTLKFVLPDRQFKVVGAGRTDAKVSALGAAFELLVDEDQIPDLNQFKDIFNENLPADIKILEVIYLNKNFNIIQRKKIKTYHYFFSFGNKNHPFCAPFMANFLEDLDLDSMRKAASYYEGEHDFRAYTVKAGEDRIFERSLLSCRILENNFLEANFFPAKSYVLIVSGQGFMRYQIRMIMGALVQLGRGELSLEDIRTSLKQPNQVALSYIAPGSGLVLNEISFES